jgi:hypothetical protein
VGWQITVSPSDDPGDRERRVSFGEDDPTAVSYRNWIRVSATSPDDPGSALADRIALARQASPSHACTRDEPAVLAGDIPAHLFADTDGWDRAMLLLVLGRGELYQIEAGALTPQDWERNQAAIEAAIRSFAVS